MKLLLTLLLFSAGSCLAEQGHQSPYDDIYEEDFEDDVIENSAEEGNEEEDHDHEDHDHDHDDGDAAFDIAFKAWQRGQLQRSDPGWLRSLVKKIGHGAKKVVTAVKNALKRLKVCYSPYGCFTNSKPWNLVWHVLPRPPSVVKTFCELYTRKNHKGRRIDPLNIRASRMNVAQKTIVIIHGWKGDYKTEVWIRHMRDEFLERGDFNIIGVYWPGGAKTSYFQAVGNARLVGAQVAYLLQNLYKELKLDFNKVHIIGFSLGGQIAGFAGHRLRDKGHLIARITGIDPAGPNFARRPRNARLDATDARFVDVIHTSLYGIKQPCGHVDFYVNWRIRQPGCIIEDGIGASCSHFRAVQLYTRTINPSSCNFTGHKCSSYFWFRIGYCHKCTKNSCVLMGYNTPTTARGIYYIKTSGSIPYCYQLGMNTKEQQRKYVDSTAYSSVSIL